MSLPLIVIGSGGHAKVVVDILRQQNRTILGLTDSDRSRIGMKILGSPILGDDQVIESHRPGTVRLVLGIGSIHSTRVRRLIFETFTKKGYEFETLIHSSAIIGSEVNIQAGAQIMAGAVLQSGTYIGMNSIVNTRASIDHDCQVESHCHVAPGAVLSGFVFVGESTHVGTGSVIIQGVNIGKNCCIAAGAVVIRDVPPGVMVVGVPAEQKISKVRND